MNKKKVKVRVGGFLAGTIAFCLIALILMCSCTTTKYVAVPGPTKEIHHNHTDSIRQTDSVYHEKETVIMQLDSGAMAKYGIQLKAADRAWLVRTAELERRLQQLAEMHNDTIHETDSIPYPVEVVKEVPAEFSWWQRTQMYAGDLLLLIVAGVGFFFLVKYLKSLI